MFPKYEISSLENKNVLMSCIIGSRACGFFNKTSDFDIRFVYIVDLKTRLLNKEKLFIDSISENTDTVGYELTKYLSLVKKSGVTPLEWLCGENVQCVENFDKHIREIYKYADKRKMYISYVGQLHSDIKKLCKQPTIKQLVNCYKDALYALYILAYNDINHLNLETVYTLLTCNNTTERELLNGLPRKLFEEVLEKRRKNLSEISPAMLMTAHHFDNVLPDYKNLVPQNNYNQEKLDELTDKVLLGYVYKYSGIKELEEKGKELLNE